jgi:hypothetical protein
VKIVPPSNTPALVRALGPDPIVVTVKGAVQPANRYGTITLRRARGSRDPIGSPATCALDIGLDATPTWEKGDPISVKLSDAALARLFPGSWAPRTNLLPNPSFGLNLTGWAATRGTLARATTGGLDGDGYAIYTSNDGSTPTGNYTLFATVPVTAGETYTFSAYVLPDVAGDYDASIQWHDAADALVSLTGGPAAAAQGGWVRLTVTGTAPAGATKVRLAVRPLGALAVGKVYRIDQALFEKAATAGPYFDGFTAPALGWTTTWTGPDYASTSNATFVAADQARYRFQGRISDLTLTTTRGTARANIIATGFLAALGGIDVGDAPWPAEPVKARVLRVLAAAQADDPGIRYQVPTTFDGPQVPAQDVDRTPAQQLLEALSETSAPSAGVWERRDGTLYWADGFSTDLFPQLELDGGTVAQPLQHVQSPRVNQATVTPSGKPTVGQLLYINQCTNPSFEVNLTGWVANASTLVRDTAVFQTPGVASLKATCTAVNNMGAYYQVSNCYPGQVLTVTAKVRRTTTGTARINVQWLTVNNGTLLGTGPETDTTVTANTWTRIGAELGPAPEGATVARVFIQIPGATVGQVLNIDRVGIYDPYGGVPPKSLDYFDGASTSPTSYTYAWEGTAHASRSFARATADTPQPSYTATDLASTRVYGVRAEQVNVLNDVGAAGFGWSELITRAQDQWLAGGWAPPNMTVDVLALLDGRVDYVQTADTPVAAAAAVLLAELGSGRQYYTSGAEPSFVPDLSTFGIVTALNETISAHRWTIETSAERTF